MHVYSVCLCKGMYTALGIQYNGVGVCGGGGVGGCALAQEDEPTELSVSNQSMPVHLLWLLTCSVK